MYLKLQMPELMTCDALNQPTSITNFYTKTWKDFISYNAENNSTKKKFKFQNLNAQAFLWCMETNFTVIFSMILKYSEKQ